MTRRISFRCDAGSAVGAGHVMRCLALAEELSERGVQPVFHVDLSGLEWVAAQLARRGFETRHPPPDRAAEAAALVADAERVVFDSYLLPAEVYRDVRRTGRPTLALVDGVLRGAEADVLVDQNLGAEAVPPPGQLPAGARWLAGVDYALIRDEVIAARPATPPTGDLGTPAGPPGVLAFFGGTDPNRAAPVVLTALAATRTAFAATFVVPSPELGRAVEAVALATGQTVRVIGLTDELARLVRASDLVLSAAGTSTYELFALGACVALVCVADNQEPGYQAMVGAGVATGLGRLAELRVDPAGVSGALGPLLTDAGVRRARAEAAWRLVDGRGRTRVADALLSL